MAVPLGVLQQNSIEFLDATACTDHTAASCIPIDLRMYTRTPHHNQIEQGCL